MQQREELDAIFGRKSEEATPDEPEKLQVFVTTTHKQTFKLISIGVDNVGPVLPLLVNMFLQAVHEYTHG